MKSRASKFATSLLIVGIVLIAVGGIGLSYVKHVSAGQSSSEVWYYSCNLTAGKTYRLYIESHDEWGKPFGSGDITSPQPVNVTITSPTGGNTSLAAYFYGLEASSPMYKEGTPPTIIEVRYIHLDEGLWLDTSKIAEIRFTARYSGTYTAQVEKDGLWSDYPPLYFAFYEETAENRDIFTSTMFGGGMLATVGGVGFVVTFFKKQGVKPKKRKK